MAPTLARFPRPGVTARSSPAVRDQHLLAEIAALKAERVVLGKAREAAEAKVGRALVLLRELEARDDDPQSQELAQQLRRALSGVG